MLSQPFLGTEFLHAFAVVPRATGLPLAPLDRVQLVEERLERVLHRRILLLARDLFLEVKDGFARGQRLSRRRRDRRVEPEVLVGERPLESRSDLANVFLHLADARRGNLLEDLDHRGSDRVDYVVLLDEDGVL